MHSIFAVPWAALELKHVREFLASAGDEGLTWEAKGEKDGRPISTKMVGEEVCALANSVGGYLILGAEQLLKGGPWTLTGVSLKDPEPKAWASRVICDRLRPVPRFDVQPWPVGDEKHVIVVQVFPVAVAPCLTIDGLAYERVTSQTKKIDDPVRLADLLRRGQNATNDSERKARAAADLIDAAKSLGGGAALKTRLTIGLAATGYAPDIASRLFSQRFMDTLDEGIVAMADGLDAAVNLVGLRPTRSHNHTTVEMSADLPHPTMPENQQLGVVAAWDGSVSLTWAATTRDVSVDFAADQVCRLGWEKAAILVKSLGGYGEAHLTVRVISHGGHGPSYLVSLANPIERKVGLDDPASLDLASLKREMLRASGLTTYEP